MNNKNVMYMAEFNKKHKSKMVTSGNKAHATLSIMIHLEKAMKERGASVEDLMQFEEEFLEQNGIVVPGSFWKSTRKEMNDSIDIFFNEKTRHSNYNIKAKDGYNAYKDWCISNGIVPVIKMDWMDYLKDTGRYMKTGTVNGATYQNVIPNTKIV